MSHANSTRQNPQDACRLPDPPAGSSGNRYARADQIALAYCGAACDYDTIAGDSGLAFILQADSRHTPYGANVEELDLGWWPLDDWGAMLRLDFLGRAHGIPLRRLPCIKDEYRSDPAKHFDRHHRPAISECLAAQRPVVAVESAAWVVTGLDAGVPPLLGQESCSNIAEVKRLGQFPWTVVVPGEMREPIERLRADREAIAFAVSLHDDRFSDGESGCPIENSRDKSSGKASFALWSQVLRDGKRCGPAHYSANVVGNMRRNRRSAPIYLRQMSARHPSSVAHALNTAADFYDRVIEALGQANTSKEAFATAAGRLDLAQKVDAIASLESSAVNQLRKAVEAMCG